jgi:hypothetical protein
MIEKEIEQGRQAKELLENPLLNECFNALEKELSDQWKSSSVEDQDAREKLYLMYKMQERLKLHIKTFIDTGKMAEAILQKDTLAQKAMRLIG